MLNIYSGAAVESTESGDAVYNDTSGSVNIYGGTVEAAGGTALYNLGTANITGGEVTSGSTDYTVYNRGGTLTVGGSAEISNTRTGYALQADKDSSRNTVTHITGGSITASGNAAVNISYFTGAADSSTENNIYLSGKPTITGGESHADIYIDATSAGSIPAKLYANSQNGNTSYQGNLLELDISQRGNINMNGQIVVYGSTDITKFTLVANEDDDHILVVDTENSNLVLHKHSWSSSWSSTESAHWHECTASGCPITNDTQKYGYATHSAPKDDGNCTTAVTCATCDYVFTAANSTHSYTYSGQGAVITETCSNTGCTAHTETATIKAP